MQLHWVFLRRLRLILNVSHSYIFCSCSQVSELITHNMFFSHEKKKGVVTSERIGCVNSECLHTKPFMFNQCCFGGSGRGPLARCYCMLPHFIYTQSPAALIKHRRLCVVYFLFFFTIDLTLSRSTDRPAFNSFQEVSGRFKFFFFFFCHVGSCAVKASERKGATEKDRKADRRRRNRA